MRKQTFGQILGLVVISALAMLVPNKVHAEPATGPYYALPSWDQKLPASTRFVALIDWNMEAVLDRETGLVWERSPQSPALQWGSNAAGQRCANFPVGGRSGWRLPSFTELASLIDAYASPEALKLPPGHPFTNVQPKAYWSATTAADFPDSALTVSFGGGSVNTAPKSEPLLVWCVRGGGPLSVY